MVIIHAVYWKIIPKENSRRRGQRLREVYIITIITMCHKSLNQKHKSNKMDIVKSSGQEKEERTVQWGATCQIRFVSSPSTTEERQAVWYDSTDFSLFRDLEAETGACGAECLEGSKQEKKRRRRRQHTARFAVFEEQRYQQTVGRNRPEMIARSYHHASRAAQDEAHERAQSIALLLDQESS